MKTIAIMPGRFHPPHKGHKAVYDKLAAQFGPKNTFIATSDKQETGESPFSFIEKKKLWQVLGVPASQIIQVSSPYRPIEITDQLDADNTAVVYGLSKKDADRFSFKPKKDGSPSYMQRYNKNNLQPLSQAGYVLTTPTVSFPVAGKKVSSATQIRGMYARADSQTREQIITDLYGIANPAVKKLFDKQLAMPVTESLLHEYLDFINNF